MWVDLDGALEARTASAVKETVAGFDGIVNLVGACVVVDFPEAESYDGHLRS